MLEYHDIVGSRALEIDLEVVISGLDITVRAGTFRHVVEHQITDDVEASFSQESVPCIIYGYLVEVIETVEITVLFDKQLPGDIPFVFDRESPYRLIETLIVAELPANATDFSSEDVKFKVFRIRPASES